MSVLEFPKLPDRAIFIDQAPNGLWGGYFPGDEWTPRFEIEVGELRWVLQAAMRGDVRQGLPIVNLVEVIGRHDPEPSPWPFSTPYTPGGGHAA